METLRGRVAEGRPVSPAAAAGLASVSRTGRRRRPSGEAPPLPRPISASGHLYLALGAGLLAFWVAAANVAPFSDLITRGDLAVLRAITELRTDGLTGVMRDLHALGSDDLVLVLRWGTVLALLVLRRFRHLLVFLGLTLLIETLLSTSSLLIGRLRPAGIEILAGWSGYSHPSIPLAALGLSLMGILYTLVPGGRWRNSAKWVAGVPVVLLCVARLYLGVDHPTDQLAAAVIGMAIPVVTFRILTPNEVFPVRYRHRGKAAHLDVTGRRGSAIAQAVDQQLGITVLEATPFGLEGSSGSTPLRLWVALEPGEPNMLLFGKLYAESHLRSDRWYKLGRAILYGRLEDESTFSSVRRLVEYEDYLLRVLRDAGLPTAEPHGFVEITPEREYLIVTGFFDGAVELGGADVDEAVLDDALDIVRRLWDAGLAHRDIKPANLLVAEGRVLLIDVAFATVRPTPWRQAVDLANMMLTLALRADPALVYARACERFSADEIAEAFAATRSATVPAQLRAMLRADGRDLLTTFRDLAPHRQAISIQAWSVRRVMLLAGVLLAAAVAATLVAVNLRAAGLL